MASLEAQQPSQPASQQLSQQPLSQPVADSSADQVYSHAGHLYFLVLSTLTVLVKAPLLTQFVQLLHPLPSQESQPSHWLLLPHLPNGKQPLPVCQGKTTFGMQMVLHSTSKQVFSTSTSSAVSLQRQSGQLKQPTQQPASAFGGNVVDRMPIDIAIDAARKIERFMIEPFLILVGLSPASSSTGPAFLLGLDHGVLSAWTL